MHNIPRVPGISLLAPMALVLALGACSGGSEPASEAAVDADAVVASDAREAEDAPPVPSGDPMAGQLAVFGGGMHALAEACGGYSAAELDRMKAEQRDQAIQAGASGADFDAGFAKGHAEASAKIANASAQEREKSCAQAAQLRQMGAMQPH